MKSCRESSKHCRSFLSGVLVGLLLAFVVAKIAAWRRDLDRFNRALYNFIAPVYDRFVGEQTSFSAVRRELVDMMELQPGDKVLEVSVGTGANLPFICDRIGPSGRIFGLDISEGMLARARKKLSRLSCPVELRLGRAEELTYADNSFDAVLHVGGINYFADRRRALEEMARVAKPGAKIVVSDETIAPFDGFRALLARVILPIIPRLRPPLNMVPDGHAVLHYIYGGALYAIEWRKAGT